jgi:formylglycine-generating enzyme required for sulfatase activity
LASDDARSALQLLEDLHRQRLGIKYVFFVDQFEEVFTLAPKEEADRFLHLLSVSLAHSVPGKWVLTLRSDFLPEVSQLPDFQPYLNAPGGIHHLCRMGEDSLRAAIEGPAAAATYDGRAGFSVEPGLVKELIRETLHEAGDGENLPLLNFALRRLFACSAQRADRTLRLADLSDMGGIDAALQESADHASSVLGLISDSSLSRIFAALVKAPSDGTKDWARRRADLRTIKAIPGGEEFVRVFSGGATVLKNRVPPDIPLLRTAAENGIPTVEVIHERLFNCWPKLKEWLSARKVDLFEYSVAVEQAHRWALDGYHPRFFDWQARRIANLRSVVDQLGLDCTAELGSFLNPGRRLAEALEEYVLTPDERHGVGRYLSDAESIDGLEGEVRYGVGVHNGAPEFALVEIPGKMVVTLERSWRDGSENLMCEAPNESLLSACVEPIFLTRFLVTQRQFREFVMTERGYRCDDWWVGLDGARYTEDDAANFMAHYCANFPATNVNWYTAVAFSRWASDLLGFEVRLPTEPEWQLAAGGADRDGVPLQYPWGDTWESGRCNSREAGLSGPSAVGVFPATCPNHTAGLYDIAGNVWEWCLTSIHDPFLPATAAVEPVATNRRVLRGGAFFYSKEGVRCGFRNANPPSFSMGDIGFRLVRPQSQGA